jgi:hypothetical protein
MGTIDSSAVHEPKFTSHKVSMPTVTCVCGSEILVVPDLKAMKVAIKKHVAEHRKPDGNSETLSSLEQFLTEEVLIAVSELNLQSSSDQDIAPSPVDGKPKFPKSSKSQQWTT